MSRRQKKHKTNPQSQRPVARERTVTKTALSVRKKTLFAMVAAALFFGMIETVLFIAGVQPIFADKDPFVGFSAQAPLLEEETVDGQLYMKTAANKLRWFNAQSIPKRKPTDSYRIVCVGGSTTFGRPYDDQTSFSGWLRELLPRADSNRKWEVINAGGISYASYRIVRVMKELSKYQPDLFVIYTGHNEFLEERTYRDVKQLPGLLRNTISLLSRTRTYSALQRALYSREESKLEGDSLSDAKLQEEVKTRLDDGVGPDAYHRDLELAANIIEHLRFNLKRMIEIARDAGADVILVTPASNLANSSPFKSQHIDGFQQLAAWQDHYDQARKHFDQQDFETARLEIEKALELSNQHAHAHYLHGRILQQLQRYDLANEAFVRARDEDVCPLRAVTEIIQVVRQVAADEGVALVDFVDIVQERSPHGIAGESLFLDHVHPTIEGNRILALELFDQLAAQQIVLRPERWEAEIKRVVDAVDQRIDTAAHGAALRNLSKVLLWAGKKDEANRLALKANQLAGNDAETVYLAGNALLEKGLVEEAKTKFQQVLQNEPNHVLALNSLGTAFLQQRNLDEAQQSLQRAVDVNPDFAPAHNNLGTVFSRKGDSQRAIEHYQKAIRLNPRYSKAYNNVGTILRQQKKWAEAKDCFEKALAINADFVEAHYNLGTILDMQGDTSLAYQRYRQALRLRPDYAPALLRAGIYLETEKQWRPAADAYRQAMKSKIPSIAIEALRRLAWIMATCPESSLRNGRLALQLAKKCVEVTKQQDAEALSTLAAACAESSDFSNAVMWQNKAIQKCNPSAKPRYLLRLQAFKNGKPWRAAS